MAGAIVVIGGTSGLGKEIARRYASTGHEVVLSGRDQDRAGQVAAELGGKTTGIALELTKPEGIAASLEGVDRVERLVLSAIDRDSNTIADYNLEAASRLVIAKLVGYTEVIHAL
ncbi:MAG: SDR family NAD(P)-dependent oxidoreductase, partial [Acidimicrobiia bacterium]